MGARQARWPIRRRRTLVSGHREEQVERERAEAQPERSVGRRERDHRVRQADWGEAVGHGGHDVDRHHRDGQERHRPVEPVEHEARQALGLPAAEVDDAHHEARRQAAAARRCRPRGSRTNRRSGRWPPGRLKRELLRPSADADDRSVRDHQAARQAERRRASRGPTRHGRSRRCWRRWRRRTSRRPRSRSARSRPPSRPRRGSTMWWRERRLSWSSAARSCSRSPGPRRRRVPSGPRSGRRGRVVVGDEDEPAPGGASPAIERSPPRLTSTPPPISPLGAARGPVGRERLGGRSEVQLDALRELNGSASADRARTTRHPPTGIARTRMRSGPKRARSSAKSQS